MRRDHGVLVNAAKLKPVRVFVSDDDISCWFQNKLGDTALHAAAWKGYSDIVEMLLNKSEYLQYPPFLFGAYCVVT